MRSTDTTTKVNTMITIESKLTFENLYFFTTEFHRVQRLRQEKDDESQHKGMLFPQSAKTEEMKDSISSFV